MKCPSAAKQTKRNDPDNYRGMAFPARPVRRASDLYLKSLADEK
jgi:hypothetical protein